jgi:hypothetical protein
MVEVRTSSVSSDLAEGRVWEDLQKPYMEVFTAHLERVGFRVWEPAWARLEREGFRELGAWWKNSYETEPTEIDAREEAELEKIASKLTTDDEARIEQIFDYPGLSTWIIQSSVLDIVESEIVGLPKGDSVLVWHWSMNKRATVLDGALRIDLFTDPADYNPNRKFGKVSGHGLMMKSKFRIKAAAAADWAATVFLPHARQLCADMNATLLEEEAKLERIRDQLTEEIIRVRERRAEQEKRLKLEVEQ